MWQPTLVTLIFSNSARTNVSRNISCENHNWFLCRGVKFYYCKINTHLIIFARYPQPGQYDNMVKALLTRFPHLACGYVGADAQVSY